MNSEAWEKSLSTGIERCGRLIECVRTLTLEYIEKYRYLNVNAQKAVGNLRIKPSTEKREIWHSLIFRLQ